MADDAVPAADDADDATPAEVVPREDDAVPAPDDVEPDDATDPPASIMRGVVAALILGAAGVAAWLAIAPDSDEIGTVTTDTPTSVPGSTAAVDAVALSTVPTTIAVAPPTAPATTAAPITAPPTTDLRALPAGLGCEALTEMGLGYTQVVQYWNGTAQPIELDADADGEPCEQSFTRPEIEAVLGDGEPIDESSTTVPGGPGLAPGLRCAELRARSVSVNDAIAYYLAQGSPPRMDADGNGIPCESAYADAAAAWRNR